MKVQSRRDYNCFGCPVYGGFNQTFALNSSLDERSGSLDVCGAVRDAINGIMGRNPDMYDPTRVLDAAGNPVGDPLEITHVQYVAGVGRNGCDNIRLRTYHLEPAIPVDPAAAPPVPPTPAQRIFLREYR